VIQPSELAQHIQQIRAEGFPDYTVRPEGERDVYTAIIFLEPFDARNQRAFGYDMFSESIRRAAMERARDTNTVSISNKVTLVQETEQDVQAGFLMYVPVYKHGMPINSVEERRAALTGYVYSPFRIKNLIQGIFPEPLDDIDFEIFDGVEVSSSTLMYDSDESGRGLDEEAEPMFFDYRTIDLYCHQWTLYFATTPSFELVSAQFESWGILAAGMVISLLAFLFIKRQKNIREQALALAQEMTSALRKREKELINSEAMWHGLVNTNPESVFLMDTTGIVLAANETVAQRLGRDVQEMIGADIFDLLPPEVAAQRKAYVDEVIASGKPVRFEDIRDGRYVDNYIYPMLANDGKLTGLSYLGIDITEHKRVEQKLNQYSKNLEELVEERTKVLEETNIGLQNEMTGRKKIEIELRKLSQAVEQSPAVIVITDRGGRIEYVNPMFEEHSGYTTQEALGVNPRILKSGVHSPEFYKNMWDILSSGQVWRGELCNKKKNGELYWEYASISPMRNESGENTHYVAVKEDITERKKIEEELKKAKQVAETANKAKSEFLANMSHELRTPLNAINGFSEVLLEKYFGDLNAKQEEYVHDILESGNHLLSLINDILDLSKVEAGKEVLELAQVDIKPLLENSLVMIKEKSMKHNIALEVKIPDNLTNFQITADQRKIKQVMYNLLSNAAKFTSDGGIIKVEAAKLKDKIQVSVSDTGIGISKEEQDKIFDEFYQVRNDQEAKQQGTGLGLSLVKRYIEMHGGRVWVESEGYGKGGKFSFTLPIKQNLQSK
jgi:PAS domain S-box-containing protein